MTWRLHATHIWPAPATVGAGLYDEWAASVRVAAHYSGPVGFKACELQVEVDGARPELNLIVLLAWVERLLGELRVVPSNAALRGATIWRSSCKGVRVTLWEAGVILLRLCLMRAA